MQDLANNAMVAKGRTRKAELPRDLLEYDTQQAEALGYGVRYGQYKADHPNTRAEFERLKREAPRPKPAPHLYEHKCARCGGTFYKTPNGIKKYCGPECSYAAKLEQSRKANTTGRTKSCKTCGQPFMSYGGTKYCCKECLQTARNIQNKRYREKYKQEEK